MAGIIDTLKLLVTPSKDVATPAQLYEQAVPRAERVMKQYDAAAPAIDFATQHPVIVAGVALVLGAFAVVGGNYLYDYLKKR